jgi:hypothetical protein
MCIAFISMVPDMRQGKHQVIAIFPAKEGRTGDKNHKFGKLAAPSPHIQNSPTPHSLARSAWERDVGNCLRRPVRFP